MEAFRRGAGLLQAIHREIEGLLEILSRLNGGDPNLAGRFDRDCVTFGNQFKRLYTNDRR